MAKEKSIAEIKATVIDHEAELKKQYNFVNYEQAQKMIAQEKQVMSIHKFGDEKLYGFEKEK